MNSYLIYVLYEKGYRKEHAFDLAIKYRLTATEEKKLYKTLEKIENNSYKNLMEV
jgi:hypothetical protein